MEVVKILIQAGAEVNIQNEKNETPLHRASANGQVEVITALLAAGADKTAKTKYGLTPHDLVEQDCLDAL